MAGSVGQLRKQAKEMGIPVAEIRGATSATELTSLIKQYGKNGTGSRKVAKKAVKKSVAAKSTTKAAKPQRRAAKSAPAKSRNSGKAKRQTTTRTSTYEPKGGRNLLDGVDFSDTDGWNPRVGSAPDRIVKLLRKYRGNRDKVFDALVGEIGDFVKPRRADGSKWTRDEREAMLRYRIARTAWDFALKTGQHEKAENRVEYGTGGTGQGIYKPAKKGNSRTTARKSTSKPAAKRGRPATTTGKKRGRPPGSKNKPKVTASKARAAGRKAARRK